MATLLGGVWGGGAALVDALSASVFMWPTRESGVISLIAFVVSGAIVIGTVSNEVVARSPRDPCRNDRGECSISIFASDQRHGSLTGEAPRPLHLEGIQFR